MNFKTRWENCEEKSLYVPKGRLPVTQRQFVFWNYWRIFDRFISRYLNKYALLGGKIKSLEVGAGRGTISKYLQTRRESDIKLVDNDDGAINIARDNFPAYKVFKGDALALDFLDDCFDLVFSTGLAEHIDPKDIQKFYDEQFRVLKAGGLMISLNIPHKFSIQCLNVFKKGDYVRSEVDSLAYSLAVVNAGFDLKETVQVNPFPLFTNIPRFFELPITTVFLAIYWFRSWFTVDAFYGSEKWSQAHIIVARKPL